MDIYIYQRIFGSKRNEPRTTGHEHYSISRRTSSSSSENWWNKNDITTKNKQTQV